MRAAIYKWLLNLFHVHQWQDEKVDNIEVIDSSVLRGKRLVGHMYIQKCSECGHRRTQHLTV